MAGKRRGVQTLRQLRERGGELGVRRDDIRHLAVVVALVGREVEVSGAREPEHYRLLAALLLAACGDDITEINAEPWHLRYVGIPVAAYIMENGLCLEEFVWQLQAAIQDFLDRGGDPEIVAALPTVYPLLPLGSGLLL